RLGERAVGGRDLAVADPDGRRRLDRLEGVAAQVVAALLDAFGEREILAHECVGLALRHRLQLLFLVVDQAQVLHVCRSLCPIVAGESAESTTSRQKVSGRRGVTVSIPRRSRGPSPPRNCPCSRTFSSPSSRSSAG